MSSQDDFPSLTPANSRVTSPPDHKYNCIGWAAGDALNFWTPFSGYWPLEGWPEDDAGLEGLVRAFQSLGYVDCDRDDSFEPGWEKVAFFGTSYEWKHAARQLPSGWWASKLGMGEDIEHETPEAVCGEFYGEVVQIMKRPRPASPAG